MKERFRIGLALVLFLALLAPSGCSGPDEDGHRGEERVEVGGGRVPADEPRGYLRIERAFLGSAGDTDLIDARVGFGGEAVWPDCFLVDGPTHEAMERAGKGGETYRGRLDSPWTSADDTEKRLDEEGALVFSFAESPGSDAPDPDRTPYFVYCSSWDGHARYDRAHVEGTPEP